MLIQAFNPDISQYEKTTLSSPVAVGATSLPVKNSNLFANADRIMVGDMGYERTEILSVTSGPTVSAIPTGATTQPHNTDDNIYRMRFDQVRFYRSTTGAGGSYSLLTTLAMDVDNADKSTYYDDAAGLSTYYYKTSYYHSITGLESQQSDPIPGAGFSRNTAGDVIHQVRAEISDQEENLIGRDEILTWFNEVNDDLITKSRRPYDFLLKTSTADATAGQDIPYPADMWKFDRLDYTYSVGGVSQTYAVRTKIPEAMRQLRYNNNAIPNDYLQFIDLDEVTKTFQVYPIFATTRAGVVTIRYWKTFTDITSESQALETPNPKIYKMYLMARFFRKKAQTDQNFLNVANSYLNDYNQEVMKLQRYNNKDVGTPRSMGGFPTTLRGYRRF